MSRRLATAVALLALAASGAAQPVPDHLKCFKVKDAQAKAAYFADLDGLVAETGCKIKVPAALACVPSQKTNVTPPPPGGGAPATPGAFGCYKLTCPKGAVPPVVQLVDQFGDRAVTPGPAKMVCAPATLGTPCLQAFEPRLQDVVALFERSFDADGNFELPVSCGGGIATCCPNGLPTSPCGPLHAELVSAAIADQLAADRLGVTYGVRLTTVAGIPIHVLGATCPLQIDTTAGTSPTIQVSLPLELSPDHREIVGTGAVVITGLTTDDFTVGGGIACQTANLALGFYLDLVTSMLEDRFTFAGLCRFCDSTIGACP